MENMYFWILVLLPDLLGGGIMFIRLFGIIIIIMEKYGFRGAEDSSQIFYFWSRNNMKNNMENIIGQWIKRIILFQFFEQGLIKIQNILNVKNRRKSMYSEM